MDRPEDKFTHDELVQLLQRSITLQERDAERVYTEEDLVSAAKELGVSPDVMREAVKEHRERAVARRAAPRPFDTRIELVTTDRRFELRIPPVRVTGSHGLPLTFMTTWFGFVGFWTFGASHAGFFFAAFSLPFWVAGLGMARRFFLPLFRKTTLVLDRAGEGVLRTWPFGRPTRLDVAALRVREGALPVSEGGAAPPSVLFLEHGTQTLPLLDGFSEAEVKWVAEELRAFLPREPEAR